MSKKERAARIVKSDTEITKSCGLCENGRLSADGSILCIKCGVMDPDDVCKKFSYDPLKREPKLPPKQHFDKSEFDL